MYVYYTVVRGVYIGPAGRLIIRKGDNDNSHTHTRTRTRAYTPFISFAVAMLLPGITQDQRERGR